MLNQSKSFIYIGIAILAMSFFSFVTWLYFDRIYQKEEKERQEYNSSQLRRADSLNYVSQILNEREINEYLEYNNKSLADKLKADGIKTNRIESILSTISNYKDTTSRFTDVSSIVDKIKNNIPSSQPFSDNSDCMNISGFVKYQNDSLKVVITNRTYNDTTSAVAYWQRRKWKFLGISTRFLGKKEFTAKSYSNCVEPKIMKIEKKKD